MAYRIMIVVEDIDYLPEYNEAAEPREVHGADAGWYGWTGMAGDVLPTIFVDYEDALAHAEALTVVPFTTVQWIAGTRTDGIFALQVKGRPSNRVVCKNTIQADYEQAQQANEV